MTSLGTDIKYRDSKFIIYLSVSGDLSHAYHLVPADSESGGYIGIGYAFNTLAEAKQWMRLARKIGYGSPAFKRKYDKTMSTRHFGFLTFKEARPYLRGAYGPYATKYRRMLRKKGKKSSGRGPRPDMIINAGFVGRPR